MTFELEKQHIIDEMEDIMVSFILYIINNKKFIHTHKELLSVN